MPWIRIGTCNQCGDCCDLKYVTSRLKTYLECNVKPTVIEEHLKTKGCPHFKRQESGKGVCLIYPTRPWYCQMFPVTPADILALPRCSYRFTRINATQKSHNAYP